MCCGGENKVCGYSSVLWFGVCYWEVSRPHLFNAYELKFNVLEGLPTEEFNVYIITELEN